MSPERAQKLYPDDDADKVGTPASAKGRSATRTTSTSAQTPLALPQQVLPGTAGAGTDAAGTAKATGTSSATGTATGTGTTTAAPATDKAATDQSLLSYLLGDGS